MNRRWHMLSSLVLLLVIGLAKAEPMVPPDVVVPTMSTVPVLVPESPIQVPIAPVTPTPQMPSEPVKPVMEAISATPTAVNGDKPSISDNSQRKIRDTLRKLDDLLHPR